ncbi:unnamed protein product [Microthlaspi erraticum]|uniref:Uncharacterized protein n=1 Tax=Microthlaspi erraticum TaxID=1685480 RepID=A0A6D2JUZ6_9BRAS|nr:unnamed protein product [Microthlaspi erraticum]
MQENMKWYTRVGVWIPQCPPKNWEARSWSGDGRRPSGALHQLGSARSIELAAPLLLPQSVWLPWPWWSLLARTAIWGSIYWESW